LLQQHDLSGLIDSRYPFDDEQCRFLALQMMRALAYLQDNRIMHRDIKSANFLVSNMLVLKLADFGMARQVPCEADAVLLRDGQTQHPAMALLNCGGGRGSSPRDVFSNNVSSFRITLHSEFYILAASFFYLLPLAHRVVNSLGCHDLVPSPRTTVRRYKILVSEADGACLCMRSHLTPNFI
jgi:serine/threonine protein kinase